MDPVNKYRHGVLIGNVRWYRLHRGVGFVLTGVGGS